MKNSYRGQGVKGNADYIQSQGFKGQNEGALTNLLKMVYGSYKAYKTLPPDLRYKWFGDKRARAEDAALLDKGLLDQATGKYKWEIAEEEANKAKQDEIENEKNTAMNEQEQARKANEGYEEYNESLQGDVNPEAAWESGKLMSGNIHDVRNASQPLIDQQDGWTEWSTEANPAKEYDWAGNGGSWNEEGYDNTIAWQKFLRNQGYKIGLDGNWQGKTQAAYEDWLSKHPEYEQ